MLQRNTMCVTPDECKSMLGFWLFVYVRYCLLLYCIVCYYDGTTYRDGEIIFKSTDWCEKW